MAIPPLQRSKGGCSGRDVRFIARPPSTESYERLSRGVVSISAKFLALYERAATYVDKIIKGAKPVNLPVEQPTTFQVVLNMKTARALGLTISLDSFRTGRPGRARSLRRSSSGAGASETRWSLD